MNKQTLTTNRALPINGKTDIPNQFYRAIGAMNAEGITISVEKNTIVIRPRFKSFAECCKEWWNDHLNQRDMYEHHAIFRDFGDYTMCVVINDCTRQSRYGVAKRHKDDHHDAMIGRIAAYARAIGMPVKKMVDYKGK